MRPATPRLSLLTSHLTAPSRIFVEQGKKTTSGLPRSRANRGVGNITKMAPSEVKSFDYIVIGGGSGGSGTVC